MLDNQQNLTEAVVPDSLKGADKPRGRWVWICLALAALTAVVLFLVTAEDAIDITQTEAAPSLQLVSIEVVPVGAERVEVTAFAEVKPRWSAELRAAVSGRVVDVLESALAGEQVTAGTKLIAVENSRYVAELAASKLALKEANLKLWQAKNAAHVASMQYKRSKTKAPNDLALKLPQLDIAKSAVISAKARISAANRQVQDAKVVAPFSGFITERFISPGQSVNPGDRLLKLVDNTTFELTVELGRKDWVLLEQPFAGLNANILDHKGDVIAVATIRQGGGFLDQTTRQYKIFLEINGTGARSVLSGDFVRVILPGITVSGAMNIPASALTQEGYIWYLTEDNRLQRLMPQILFRQQNRIVIKAPNGLKIGRVATTPLVSFLPGQKVQTLEVEG